MKRLLFALMLMAGFAFGEGSSGGSSTVVVTDGATGNKLSVNETGQAHVVMRGQVDTNNSTSAILGISGSYTGAASETLDYAVLQVAVYSDVASATNGLRVEFSTDATNWYWTDLYTVPAGTGKTYSFQPVAQYYRVVYSNGATGQSMFELQAILKKTYIKPSSHRIQDPISNDDDAELVVNVIKAENPDGTYDSINRSASGNLLVTDAENPAAIAFGEVTGASTVQKFGNADDFDTGDGSANQGGVTVWDGANDGLINAMTYTYSSTGDIDSVISTDAGDNQLIEVQGLGWPSSNLVIQTATLNGQTRVALATNLYRVFRIKNLGSSNFAGNVSCYVTNAPTTAGVVDDSSLVRAFVVNGNNQTEMAVYTVPANEHIVLKGTYFKSAGARRDADYLITIWARPPGGVFQLKWKGAINDSVYPADRQPYETGLYFDEGTDLECRVKVLTAAVTEAAVSAGFEIIKKEK